MADASTVLAVLTFGTSAGGFALLGLVYRMLRRYDNLVALHLRQHPQDADLLR